VVMSLAGLGPENDCAGEDQAAIVKDRPVFSSERMLHKDYNPKCSVSEKLLIVSLKGPVSETN
jgi:hypothetical protein